VQTYALRPSDRLNTSGQLPRSEPALSSPKPTDDLGHWSRPLTALRSPPARRTLALWTRTRFELGGAGTRRTASSPAPWSSRCGGERSPRSWTWSTSRSGMASRRCQAHRPAAVPALESVSRGDRGHQTRGQVLRRYLPMRTATADSHYRSPAADRLSVALSRTATQHRTGARPGCGNPWLFHAKRPDLPMISPFQLPDSRCIYAQVTSCFRCAEHHRKTLFENRAVRGSSPLAGSSPGCRARMPRPRMPARRAAADRSMSCASA
jgi:hypothetical protein